MALPIVAILDAVISHAMASGLFERVNAHEPKNPPGRGLTAAVWVDAIVPVLSSGLSSTTGRLVFTVRLYSHLDAMPEDGIDPELTAAVDTLLGLYAGHFRLGGLVRHVDLLGAHGEPLRAQAGYLQQDGTEYRVFTITLPVIVNDLWEQVA